MSCKREPVRAWGVVFLIKPSGIPLPHPGTRQVPPAAPLVPSSAQPHPAPQLANPCLFRLPQHKVVCLTLSWSGRQNKGDYMRKECEGFARLESHGQRRESFGMAREGQGRCLFRFWKSTVSLEKKSSTVWHRNKREQEKHTHILRNTSMCESNTDHH